MKLLNTCLCALLLLCTLSCEKDDDNNCQGIDCLPPITQTGAGTFGCLVNGVPFYAFGGVNSQYQLINGEYNFVIGFSREFGFPRSVSIESDEKQITLGENNLEPRGNGNLYGEVRFEDFISYPTDQIYTGKLTITKLDQTNQIVSGTFEFQILNPDDGLVYEITEGRFDSFYAQ